MNKKERDLALTTSANEKETQYFFSFFFFFLSFREFDFDYRDTPVSSWENPEASDESKRDFLSLFFSQAPIVLFFLGLRQTFFDVSSRRMGVYIHIEYMTNNLPSHGLREVIIVIACHLLRLFMELQVCRFLFYGEDHLAQLGFCFAETLESMWECSEEDAAILNTFSLLAIAPKCYSGQSLRGNIGIQLKFQSEVSNIYWQMYCAFLVLGSYSILYQFWLVESMKRNRSPELSQCFQGNQSSDCI